MMFGRKKTELTQQHIDGRNETRREEELQRDPSSIPGMTQTELNSVIDTGTISKKLLRRIL